MANWSNETEPYKLTPEGLIRMVINEQWRYVYEEIKHFEGGSLKVFRELNKYMIDNGLDKFGYESFNNIVIRYYRQMFWWSLTDKQRRNMNRWEMGIF